MHADIGVSDRHFCHIDGHVKVQRVDPLLDNDRETNNETMSVAR
jgi:nitrate reductase cytochrome c-type subunit